MIANIQTLILLIIVAIIDVALITYLYKVKGKKKQLVKAFIFTLLLLIFWDIGLIAQITLSRPLKIEPIYFDYFVYIWSNLTPIAVFFIGLIYANTKIEFKKKYLLLFIMPILSLIVLWTNDFHHLFYVIYSINVPETVFGPYVILHNIYSYVLLFTGIIYLLKCSIKNSGAFSRQSILVVLGMSIPILTNVLAAFRIISITIYVTPITFTFAILFCAISIFKFQFLGVTPIALQKIVDRISDSYVVLDDNNDIIDFNQTFIETFKIKGINIRGKNLIQLLEKNETQSIIAYNIKELINRCNMNSSTVTFEQKFESIKRVFQIEITPINSDGKSLGTLFLLKDITQHKEDIATIQNNQEMLMESERLASLGQLIGGIAHNLKTPIMSISGATEGLSDLTKELDASIGNPVVTNDDFHDIAKDMNEWIEKIKSYTEYMSDIITAVKGQAVTLSNDEITSFTIVELFKRVDILMRHELKKAVVYLNSSVQVPDNISISGDVNSLVQVINNMISNAIQAYNGTPEQFIDLTAKFDDENHVVISVRDHGCGLPAHVRDKLFKEMITTKGKNGTGLGLYMSYSTIRAHFGGNITVESEEGQGTTFNVILPISK